MTEIKLVLFDCDGVLVDSEMLSAVLLMDMLSEIDMAIDWSAFCTDFLGRSFSTASARMTARFGRALPDDFQLRYREKLLAKMHKDLNAVQGVEQTLEGLRVPYALATSSSPERLAVSLSSTGLQKFFDGSCFTASEVENGKPAPDLFLYVAAKFDVLPENCLVIEDSEMGLRAGIAAKMQTWHFTGGSHFARGISLSDDVSFHRRLGNMVELQGALRDAGIWRASKGSVDFGPQD
jgi:HAD superfamily hydrolase (TIGR01509 family)